MRRKFDNVKQLYASLKANRDEYTPLWQEISRHVGIQVEPQRMYSTQTTNKSDRLDDLVDDPTASLSVNQAGDYLQGVVWGTGDNAITLEPSDYLLEKEDAALSADFFTFVSGRTLSQMNHSQAGLNSSMKAYFYDQVGFGTSGIGAFNNNEFAKGVEDNALIFRSYGVDNIAIDEGANGLIEIIFVAYQWRVNRIVQEFASSGENKVDDAKFSTLPESVKAAYKSNNVNKEYTVVQAIYPRDNYHPKLKGKRGAKYIGEWFLDQEDNKVFLKEDYKRLPIGVCRAIKVRGEVYGRSSGTLLISSIKSVNYMFSKAVEVIEKMASIPLGVWNSSIFGDSVLDTSADGLTVFNPAVSASGKNPVFPLIDVGDPSALINFLIPYLNEKITTGFKVDLLLDFQSAKEMTATESMQRYAIRGRSLAGLLQQQKIEMLEPLIHRVISLLEGAGLLGINPNEQEDVAKKLRGMGKSEMLIPAGVLQCMEEGKPWYKVRFNNELEKLSRTEALERIIQSLNALSMIAALYPPILQGVKWHDLWKDVNDFLGLKYFIDEESFKKIIEDDAKMKRQQMAIEAAKVGAEVSKDGAAAAKMNAEAQGGL